MPNAPRIEVQAIPSRSMERAAASTTVAPLASSLLSPHVFPWIALGGDASSAMILALVRGGLPVAAFICDSITVAYGGSQALI